MRYKAGTIFMLLGAVLMIGALVLFVSNQQDAAQAEKAVDEFLPQLIAEIEQNEQETVTGEGIVYIEPDDSYSAEEMPNGDGGTADAPAADEEYAGTSSAAQSSNSHSQTGGVLMSQVVIKQYSYIGYLTIPKLDLQLPIMTNWSYELLKVAPCRYSGTVMSDDLVLMAHNYARHFGRLSSLAEGDEVYFTDANGVTTIYEVVGCDVLIPTAVEEMTSGDFDLTLFTCTYGGQSRVTVYCNRIVTD